VLNDDPTVCIKLELVVGKDARLVEFIEVNVGTEFASFGGKQSFGNFCRCNGFPERHLFLTLDIIDLFSDQSSEVEDEDFGIRPLRDEVSTEGSPHGSHDTELLSIDEGLQSDSDSNGDVLLIDRLSEMHSSICFCTSDDRLNVSHSDGHGPSGQGFSTEFTVQLRDPFSVEVIEFRVDSLPRVEDVLLEQILRDELDYFPILAFDCLRCRFIINFHLHFIGGGVVLGMGTDYEGSQLLISIGVHLVPDDTQNVETRDNWFSEVDVIQESERGIISSADGVGSSNDCTPGLERSNNSCFGDGDALLLHCFMD